MREIYYFILLLIGAIVLQALFNSMPLVFIVPALLAYTLAAPATYLVTLAVATEFYSVQPFGIMTLVVALPYVGRRLFNKIEVDLTLTFFALILFTILAQFILIFLPDVLGVWQAREWSLGGAGAALAIVPWQRLLTIWAPTSLVFVLAIIIFIKGK